MNDNVAKEKFWRGVFTLPRGIIPSIPAVSPDDAKMERFTEQIGKFSLKKK